jgi:hypothetical protein
VVVDPAGAAVVVVAAGAAVVVVVVSSVPPQAASAPPRPAPRPTAAPAIPAIFRKSRRLTDFSVKESFSSFGLSDIFNPRCLC